MDTETENGLTLFVSSIASYRNSRRMMTVVAGNEVCYWCLRPYC